MAIAEITPEIQRINDSLRDSYGIDTASNRPMWRVVFSDDQVEKRLCTHSPKGILLLQPEVQERPKYQWIKHKWILENLVVVPDYQRKELAGLQTSYEHIFSFHDKDGNPLPPRYDVCQFVIHLIEIAKGTDPSIAKYHEDPEKAAKELKEMEEYLHGNETDVGDALMYGTGVSVPSNYGVH